MYICGHLCLYTCVRLKSYLFVYMCTHVVVLSHLNPPNEKENMGKMKALFYRNKNKSSLAKFFI